MVSESMPLARVDHPLKTTDARDRNAGHPCRPDNTPENVALTELLDELRAIELLAGMDDELLERIAAVVTTETLEPGQTLTSEGEIAADLYFVRCGSFVATVRDGSAAVEIARPGPGDVIGESQLIAGGRRIATVVARETSVVLCLPAIELDALVSSSVALRDALASVVQLRLRAAALRLALPRAVGSDPELLDLLSEHAAWVQLQRGEVLWEQGAPVDGWCVLVSGELSIVINQHGLRREIGSVRRGEVFGEVGVLSQEPRSACIQAARESWVARFDSSLLDDEILTRNDALRALLRTIAGRLSAQSRSAPDSAGIVAVLPRDPGVDTDGFLRALSASLGSRGLVVTPQMLHAEGVIGDVARLPLEHPGWLRFQGWIDAQRRDRDYLLLVTDGDDSAWTRVALAQADRALLLVDADADPRPNAMEAQLLSHADGSRVPPVWLVLEHPADRVMPEGTAAWLDARLLEHHAHLRRGHARDTARLARWLGGATLGVALSGGGARGFVHFGAVEAMFEAGYELDLIAGTSAGAMAGSLLARDETTQQGMQSGMTAIASQGNPFTEFDLPLISLLRSRRLRRGLRQTFGEMMIEDSWIPLRVVATNLTESRRSVAARGPVWQHVYASSSPPGAMPPVQIGDSLYCDGGLVDNLPVAVLQAAGCRVKVASYIGSTSSLPAPRHGLPASSWTLLLDRILRRGRYRDVPTLLTTMMQCILVPSSAQLELARASADIFFQPDLSAFPATDFTSARAMFETGQAHARAVLAAHEEEQARQHGAHSDG